MKYYFPAAFMANNFAMTGLLIIVGLFGDPSTAADIGIVQGATLALFYAFSANARSLILCSSSKQSSYSIMVGRLFLLIPLAVASYWLSSVVGEVGKHLAFILILRRCLEWLTEVYLSEMEREGAEGIAKNYLLFQTLFLLVAVAWFISSLPFPLLGLFIWAIIPLLYSAGFIRKAISQSPRVVSNISSRLLPHLGSTAIIGITVYVFRLLILLLVGKETAGDLYTAFAIGGLSGSIFANSLGASIALHEQRKGVRYFPLLLRQALNLSLLLGLLIYIVAALQLPILEVAGKSYLFWEATGLSMLGGVVMVYAQRIRFRLLQHDEEQDVFGPDVLMNILLVASVPFAFYLFGIEAMGALYLLSSILAYIFYMSARKEKHLGDFRVKGMANKLKFLMGVLILLPLFIQINGSIFKHSAMVYDTAGSLFNLPIPISVLVCFLGIVLLGGYRGAKVSLNFVFFSCVLMVFTSILIFEGDATQEQSKIILLIQFILPMFALVFGQLYQKEDEDIQSFELERGLMYVLIVIVPLQLLSTWFQGYLYLSPYLYIFSIYQHLQYVPVVFVSAYLIVLYQLGLFTSSRRILYILTPLMGVYTVASASILALGIFIGGLFFYAWLCWYRYKDTKFGKIFMAAIFISASYFFVLANNTSFVAEKFSLPTRNGEVIELQTADQKLLPGLAQRFDFWGYYWKETTADVSTFMLGHQKRPPRDLYPSAHNYYLDFAYNFGFLALLPILALLSMTCMLIYRYRRKVQMSLGLTGLCIVVLLLLFIDNSLKVGLRQPYPGIFTFFLWGVLLNRLLVLNADNKQT